MAELDSVVDMAQDMEPGPELEQKPQSKPNNQECHEGEIT